MLPVEGGWLSAEGANVNVQEHRATIGERTLTFNIALLKALWGDLVVNAVEIRIRNMLRNTSSDSTATYAMVGCSSRVAGKALVDNRGNIDLGVPLPPWSLHQAWQSPPTGCGQMSFEP